MIKKIYIIAFILGLLVCPQLGYAQVDFNKKPDDDLGDVEDAFQESFYEALKQKGIENYDRSVTALLKCVDLDEQVPVLYYELGKNYQILKNYDEAEKAFKKAVQLEPNNEWYLDGLYGFYVSQNDSDNAIKTLKLLTKYHRDYQQDLVSLYVQTGKYDEALKLLDELDASWGISKERDDIRNKIYDITGRKKDQIANLKSRVDSQPDKESNYLELIFRYSENNDIEKAFETAKELLKINPNSEVVHLALYKLYIDDNDVEMAIKSMKIVVKSQQIKPEAKLKVLSDFINFVKQNPEYESHLVEATNLVSSDNEKSLSELGQYYLQNGNKQKALEYFEQALKQDSKNIGLLQNVLLLQMDLKQFNEVYENSKNALEKYPSQPLLYLIQGVALNALNKPNNAIESLEMGLDYIVDDTKMEADFYSEMSKAYSLLNQADKAKTYKEKAQQKLHSN